MFCFLFFLVLKIVKKNWTTQIATKLKKSIFESRNNNSSDSSNSDSSNGDIF